MYRYVVLLLLVSSFFIGNDARSVIVDKGCGAATCKLDSMLKLLGSTITKADDVIFCGAKNVIYTITSPITCKSLNVTSGTLLLNAAADVSGNIFIAPDASVQLNGNLKCNSAVDAFGKIIVNGGASVLSKLNCASCDLNMNAGSLIVNGLTTTKDATCNIVGGTMKHVGEIVYNMAPKCSGNGNFVVDTNANVVLNSGISCLDKSILSVLSNAKVDIKGNANINSPINLDNKAICQISNNADCVIKGIKGASGSVFQLVDSSKVLLNGPSTCDLVKLVGKTNLNVDSDITVNSINTAALSNLNLAKTCNLNVITSANVDSKLNLQDAANLIINANANAKLNGGVKCLGDSTVKLLDKSVCDITKDSIFNKPITVGSASTLNLNSGICNLNSGIVANVDSNINLKDKCIANILKNSQLGKVDVISGANLNINSGANVIVNGPFSCDKKALTIVNDASLHLNGDANIASILDINGKSKVSLDSTTKLVGGINADALATIDVNGDVHILTSSDIKALTTINGAGKLNLGGIDSAPCKHTISNILSGAKSTINVNAGSSVDLCGKADLSGIMNLVDGSKVIITGDAKLNTPIKCSGLKPSDLQVGKTGVCKLLADSNINGNIIVDAGGKLDFASKCNVGSTIQNSGIMTISKPITIVQDQTKKATDKVYNFVQNAPTSVCNMVAGGSIKADTINFVGGAIKGVGALTCNTCNLANNVDANLNIIGNVNIQPTANVVAQLETSIATGAKQFVPMIVASGTANVNGAVDVVCGSDCLSAIKSGAVFKLVSAAQVNGSLKVKANANANVASNVWSVIDSPCKCECQLKKN